MQCSEQRDEPLAAVSVEAGRLPNQAETLFTGTDNAEDIITRVPVADPDKKTVSDLDYLSVSHETFLGICRQLFEVEQLYWPL